MRFFKKKVTKDEFQEFEKRIQKSFKIIRKKNRDLENRVDVLTKVIISLCPLSKQFTELQHQFTELVKQFNDGSLNNKKHKDIIPIELHSQVLENSLEIMEIQSVHLTPLEQKSLVLIGRLQNEAGSKIIPVGFLTENLYPDKVNLRIKTTVSNILNKIIEFGLINRERHGNYWHIGLTKKGYITLIKMFHQNQLKNLIQLYEKR